MTNPEERKNLPLEIKSVVAVLPPLLLPLPGVDWDGIPSSLRDRNSRKET